MHAADGHQTLGSKVEQHELRDEYGDGDGDDAGLNRPSPRGGSKRGESLSEAESESDSKSRSRAGGYWAQDASDKFSVHHGAGDVLGSRGGMHAMYTCTQAHAPAHNMHLCHFVCPATNALITRKYLQTRLCT
jgi:hypothetical protein